MYRPRYDPVTGQFLGLYELLGFIVVKGDPDEHSLDYGFCKEIQRFYILIIKEEFLVCSVTRFETENDIYSDPSKFDVHCQEKEIMPKVVVKMLKKISDLSKANLIKNADGLLSKK